jgi:hypothetical protein
LSNGRNGNVPPVRKLIVLNLMECPMKIALIGAALIATAAFAGPVSAQHVIEEPGYCAQFYPNANCQNEGPGSPYRTGYYSNGRYGSYARMGHRMHRHPAHHRGMRHHKHRR